ncbi:MAG: SCO family protein [Alphaproteobacteria bacterium]|nr:SCO family protein [Alphaproteobacteria bacterium]
MLRAIRHIAWAVAVVGALWLVLFIVFRSQVPAPTRTTVAPDLGRIGGPFVLTDQRGRPFTDRDLLGRPAMIFFGFTHCPDVCPTALAAMSEQLAALGERGSAILPVFVSVDPERDTPEMLADYLAAFDPRIVGLTGSPEQIADMAKAYKVYYRKVPLKDGGYVMDHTAGVLLVDRGGSFRGTLDPHEPLRARLDKLNMLAAR